MKELFFDTAYLCKLYWPEPGSAEVAERGAGAERLATALHARTEFYSLSHRKVREGAATLREMAVVTCQFQADFLAGAIRFLPLSEAVLARAEHVFLNAPGSVFLRAADALHLACAAENGFSEVYSNDQRLLAAAPLFGLRGVNVIA